MAGRKIEKEKKTIEKIIRLYCKYHKSVTGGTGMNSEYRDLLIYAKERLDKCPFGENKGACKNCPVHCYKPEMRKKIRNVMRWVMPRYIFISPLEFLRHLF